VNKTKVRLFADWSRPNNNNGVGFAAIGRPNPGGVEFHIDFADWTRSDDKISIGFTIIQEPVNEPSDDLFIVKLVIPDDPEEDGAVNQLGELAGGNAWHRVQRVIGQQAPGGSKLERGVLYNVMPNVQCIVELDPRGLIETGVADGGLTIIPTVYKVVEP